MIPLTSGLSLAADPCSQLFQSEGCGKCLLLSNPLSQWWWMLWEIPVEVLLGLVPLVPTVRLSQLPEKVEFLHQLILSRLQTGDSLNLHEYISLFLSMGQLFNLVG